MTREDIIRMARESEIDELMQMMPRVSQKIDRFAALVAAAEREACAQILANTDLSGLRDHPLQNWVAGLLFEFIKAIRARGNT